LTMNLTRSLRCPVASTRKIARCWGSSTRSPRMGRWYRARLSAAQGPWIASPGMERARVAVGVSDAAQRIDEGGGIAAGDVDVSSVGGGDDEPAVGASMSGIAGEGAARAEVLHGLPGGRSEWRCCERRYRPGERGNWCRRWEEGREAPWEDGDVRGSDGVEQVDGSIANGVVAVDVEELTGRAVKACRRR
jgi:hypothetical protein